MASSQPRWKSSPQQRQILLDFFDQRHGATPSKADLDEIIRALSEHGPVSKKNVKKWFQNLRAKGRKTKLAVQDSVQDGTTEEQAKKSTVSSEESSEDGEPDGSPLDQDTSSKDGKSGIYSTPRWTPTENQIQILANIYDEGNSTLRDERVTALIANITTKVRKEQVVSSKDGKPDVCPPKARKTPIPLWRPTQKQNEILEDIYDKGNGTLDEERVMDMMASITPMLKEHGPITETSIRWWFAARTCEERKKQAKVAEVLSQNEATGVKLCLENKRADEKIEQGMLSSEVSSKDREPDVCPPQNFASLPSRLPCTLTEIDLRLCSQTKRSQKKTEQVMVSSGVSSTDRDQDTCPPPHNTENLPRTLSESLTVAEVLSRNAATGVKLCSENKRSNEKIEQGMVSSEVSSKDREPDVCPPQSSASLQSRLPCSLAEIGVRLCSETKRLQKKTESVVVSSGVSSTDRDQDTCPPHNTETLPRTLPESRTAEGLTQAQVTYLEHAYGEGHGTPLQPIPRYDVLATIIKEVSLKGSRKNCDEVLTWFKRKRDEEEEETNKNQKKLRTYTGRGCRNMLFS